MAEQLCWNCRFWVSPYPRDSSDRAEDSTGVGRCHRHAPIAPPIVRMAGAYRNLNDERDWPKTQALESCGDFTPALSRTIEPQEQKP